MSRIVPQVAHVEDAAEDESNIGNPETRREAYKSAAGPPVTRRKYAYREGDPGGVKEVNDHLETQRLPSTSATIAATPLPLPTERPIRHERMPAASSNAAVVGSRDGGRQRTQTMGSVQATPCNDSRCPHLVCTQLRSMAGHMPIPRSSQQNEHNTATAPLYHESSAPIHQTAMPYYALQTPRFRPDWPQTQPMIPPYPAQRSPTQQRFQAQAGPLPTAQILPRRSPQQRPVIITRPASRNGYPHMGSWPGQQQGPPLSASAYRDVYWSQLAPRAVQHPQPHTMYQQTAAQGHPVPQYATSHYPRNFQTATPSTSPSVPIFAASPNSQRLFSARMPTAAPPSPRRRSSMASQESKRSTRAPSARKKHAAQELPSAFESDSDPESSSSEDSSSEEVVQPRARDSRLMSSSTDRRPALRRSSVKESRAAITHPRDNKTRHHRVVDRAHSESGTDYKEGDHTIRPHMHGTHTGHISDVRTTSSKSDRTIRAPMYRSNTQDSSSRSRRGESRSTTESSGLTKATTTSDALAASKNFDNVAAKANAYMNSTSGPSNDLTVERMDELTRKDRPRGSTSATHGHHRRGSARNSRSSIKTSDSGDGRLKSMKITYGGNNSIEIGAVNGVFPPVFLNGSSPTERGHDGSSTFSSVSRGRRTRHGSDTASKHKHTMRDERH